MSVTIPARVVVLEGPTLTSASVAQLARVLALPSSAGAAETGVVLDCHALTSFSPPGMAALLELRAAHRTQRWVLAALTRSLIAAALELGLVECFTICADTDAARRALSEAAPP